MIETRPAATVVVARDTAEGFEVLLLQRTHSAVFMPGVFVFPGGAVDDDDHDSALLARSGATDDARASAMIGVAEGGLPYLVAAIRECFEEGGVLLADAARGRPITELPDIDLPALRHRLCAGELTLGQICRQHDLTLHADRMGYLAHWVTPPGPPRRYDTRFFVAQAPAGQDARHDGRETVAHAWIAPQHALERNRRGEFPLGSPTIRTLRTLAQFNTTGELLRHSRHHAKPAAPVALRATGRDGPRDVHPDEPAYPEIAKLKEEGLGEGRYELLPGVETRLSPRVRRLIAPNPGAMTGPGTNTYLVGQGESIAVIDPGPDIQSHVEAVAAAGGHIRWILATHTHRDHSPATRALQRLTGAETLGMPPPPGGTQDQDFTPDRVPVHGERLSTDASTTLRVIHTPGHASNHLCFFLEEERMLFSGDHIMQGSTVVINPPDGHMGQYLHSLDTLHGEDIAHIAPGHGFLLGDPHSVIDRIISHRMAREAKVMAAMRRRVSASEDQLLGEVYDDVPPAMHTVAARSLLAHLIKLRDDGVLDQTDTTWTLAG